MRRLLVAAALVAALAAAPSAGAWTWPVDGPVLRPFVFGADPYLGGQHRGLDIGSDAGSGSPVSAPAAGVVTFAGSVPGGGRTISIRTVDGYSVTLQHLGAIAVLRGQVVTEGAPVGSVAATVYPAWTGPWVYLGVRVASEPQGYLDPVGFLSSPGLWLGLLFAAAFLAAAVRLRRYREPI